jgi:hypothetical protein
MAIKKQKEKNLSVYLHEHGKEKRKRRILRNAIFVFLSVLFIFDGVGYLVLRTRFFRTSNIEVVGNKEISSEDIMTAVRAQIFEGSYLKYIFGFGHLMIWPERFDDINKLIPKIKTVTVNKSYIDRKIVLRVEEREGYGVWCIGKEVEKCFSFDNEGVIFSRGMPSEGSLIHNVRDYSERDLGILLRVLPEEKFNHLKEIFEVVEQAGLNYKFFEIQDMKREEVEVISSSGPTVYFSLRFSPVFALTALRGIGGNVGKLQYIDFRVENKAYYK